MLKKFDPKIALPILAVVIALSLFFILRGVGVGAPPAPPSLVDLKASTLPPVRAIPRKAPSRQLIQPGGVPPIPPPSGG